MKLYMFREVALPIIRSSFTVHSALVYVIQVYRQLSSRTWSCSKAVYKPVWHIPLLSVQWINSWWRAEELPEICRISRRSKFGKLVHLVGFIIKKHIPHIYNRVIHFPHPYKSLYCYRSHHKINSEIHSRHLKATQIRQPTP